METQSDSLALQQFAWYFGAISREEAESTLLKNAENEGTFLVREKRSVSDSPGYVLSIIDWKNQECVFYHYHILPCPPAGFYIETNCIYNSIPTLVDRYSSDSSFLPVKLLFPCPKSDDQLYSNSSASIICPYIVKRDGIIHEALLYGRSDAPVQLWKGTFKNNLEKVVYKIQNDPLREEIQQQLLSEAEALIVLRHYNIVSILGVAKSIPACLILEYHPNRDLLDYTLSDQNQISYVTKLAMAQEVASALEYVSKMEYVHRNVKASNVLLDTNLSCKLTGFSKIAKLDKDGNYFATENITSFDTISQRWMAVESLINSRFSTASDIWSYGILLHEIFTNGELPYSNVLGFNVAKSIENGHRMKRKPCVPELIYEIMTASWQNDPIRRPNFTSIIAILQSASSQLTVKTPSKHINPAINQQEKSRYLISK